MRAMEPNIAAATPKEFSTSITQTATRDEVITKVISEFDSAKRLGRLICLLFIFKL